MSDKEVEFVSESDPERDFASLVVRYLGGELSNSQSDQLNAQLMEFPERRDAFVAICIQSRLMTARVGIDLAFKEDSDALLFDGQPSSTLMCHNLAALPAVGFLSTTLHGTTGFFSSGWPVAYLIATVIFGLGILVGAFTYVSQPMQTATQSPSVTTVSELQPEHVGRITGMVDCRWEKESAVSGQRSEDGGVTNLPSPSGRGAGGEGGRMASGQWPVASRAPNPLVSLGDRFALTSGLMEITYDTGAKVILQGPVTYEVESAASGYLSAGKLTARVEKKVASGQWPVASKSEMSSLTTSHWPLATNTDPQSPIPNPSSLSTNHYPLFTIKTPTATVTDLGTEFGVEVAKSGETTSHVFRGSVQFVPLAAEKGKKSNAIVLHENESIQTQRSQDATDGDLLVRYVAVDPHTFVRRLPPSMKALDLSNIVAGGDGQSRRREYYGVAPKCGGDTVLAAMTPGSNKLWFSTTDMINRVFLPDGEQGAVHLDSAKHSFGGFPKAVGKQFGSVWATPTGVVGLRPNVGITFDLKAMRDRYSGARPNRFRGTVSCRRAVGTTTLFHDDFQSDTAGTYPRDFYLNPVIGKGDTGGAWYVYESHDTNVQVQNNQVPLDKLSPAGTNNYVNLFRIRGLPAGALWGDGWNVTATVDQKLAMSYRLYIPANANNAVDVYSVAYNDTSHTHANQTFGAFFSPTGDVKAYNNGVLIDTGVNYSIGAWNDVLIAADMAAGTYTITVGTSTTDTLHWPRATGNTDRIASFVFSPDGKGSHIVIDDVKLTATAGLTESQRRGFGQGGQGDFWVFVDGRLRLHRLGLRAEDAVVPVDIEIGADDRFLTLVSTNGGDGVPADWVVWEKAVLEMAAADYNGP